MSRWLHVTSDLLTYLRSSGANHYGFSVFVTHLRLEIRATSDVCKLRIAGVIDVMAIIRRIAGESHTMAMGRTRYWLTIAIVLITQSNVEVRGLV